MARRYRAVVAAAAVRAAPLSTVAAAARRAWQEVLPIALVPELVGELDCGPDPWIEPPPHVPPPPLATAQRRYVPPHMRGVPR